MEVSNLKLNIYHYIKKIQATFKHKQDKFHPKFSKNKKIEICNETIEHPKKKQTIRTF